MFLSFILIDISFMSEKLSSFYFFKPFVHMHCRIYGMYGWHTGTETYIRAATSQSMCSNITMEISDSQVKAILFPRDGTRGSLVFLTCPWACRQHGLLAQTHFSPSNWKSTIIIFALSPIIVLLKRYLIKKTIWSVIII